MTCQADDERKRKALERTQEYLRRKDAGEHYDAGPDAKRQKHDFGAAGMKEKVGLDMFGCIMVLQPIAASM